MLQLYQRVVVSRKPKFSTNKQKHNALMTVLCFQQEGEQHDGSSGGEEEGMEALSFVKVEGGEGDMSEGERGREEERAMEECDSGPDDGDNEGVLQIVSGSEHDDEEEEEGSGDEVSNPNR
jgi:hypothetical protein